MTVAIAGNQILVTGSTGYIGSALVAELSESNDVHVLVRDVDRARSHLPVPSSNVHGDLDRPGQIAAVFREVEPTSVFHLATHYERRDDSSQIASMIDANVRFGALVLDSAASGGPCEVVLAGSHFQFAGDGDQSVSFYAATKNALTGIAGYLQQSKGLRWIQPVLFDVYGPADTRPKLVNVLLESVLTGKPISLPEPEPLHHFVYIDDVISALIASEAQLKEGEGAIGQNVFVSSAELVAPSQVLEIVAAVSGVDPILSSAHYELPSGSIMAPIEGPRPEGWDPMVSLTAGIERVLSSQQKDHSRA